MTSKTDELTTVRAVEGFFVRKELSDDSPSFFKHFDTLPSSWSDFQNQLKQLEDSDNRKVKVVFALRHAQGDHNLAEEKYGMGKWEDEMARSDEYLDPDLTPFGEEDAQHKGRPNVERELERGMPPIERVVVSTLSRTIQTAQNFFAPEQLPTAPFVCLESCREILNCYTFDKRRPLSVLKQKFPDVDFSHIKDEEDELWSPTHCETEEELQARAKVFLTELFEMVPERYVVVVTHVRFIQSLCAVVSGGSHPRPDNCEVVPLVLEAV